jgi:hypothetical protein
MNGRKLALLFGLLRNSTIFATQKLGLGQCSQKAPVNPCKLKRGLHSKTAVAYRASIARRYQLAQFLPTLALVRPTFNDRRGLPGLYLKPRSTVWARDNSLAAVVCWVSIAGKLDLLHSDSAGTGR